MLCRILTPKRHRQLRVKDLPKVPTWRLERDSNPRLFGRKATNIQMSHHAPRPSVLVPCTGPVDSSVAEATAERKGNERLPVFHYATRAANPCFYNLFLRSLRIRTYATVQPTVVSHWHQRLTCCTSWGGRTHSLNIGSKV